MRSSLLLSLLLFAICPREASAYVCSRAVDNNGNETGASLSWFWRDGGRTLRFLVHENGTEDIDGLGEFNDLRDSFLVWQNLTMEDEGGCDLGAGTDLDFAGVQSSTSLGSEVLTAKNFAGYDYLNPSQNENLFVFHDNDWPHAGQGSLIIALTTLTYNSLTGEILDADIEYNSERFPFTGQSDVQIETDLMNTTVHELGHFLGFGHTADDDDTMWPRADTGETKKRTLSCNDAKGVALKYPADATADSTLPNGAERNGYCSPTADCGFCAPPQKLSRIPTVDVVSVSTGFTEEGQGCSAALPPVLWLFLGLLYSLRILGRRER